MSRCTAPSSRSQGSFACRISAGLVPFLLALLASMPVGAAGPGSEFDLAVPKGVDVGILVIEPNLEGKPFQTLAFDVAPDGLPMVAYGRAFGFMGSPTKSVSIGGGPISDFAWMADATLSLVTQGRVAKFSDKGLYLGPRLPFPRMRIRSAQESGAYLFGADKEPDNHSVYLVDHGMMISKLIELPIPATDVTGDGKTTYVAAGQSILRISPKLPVSAVLKARDDITSIAWSGSSGLFYATKTAVGYIASNGQAYEFMRGNALRVRVQGDSVFVLLEEGPDSKEPQLMRFRPVKEFEKFASIKLEK